MKMGMRPKTLATLAACTLLAAQCGVVSVGMASGLAATAADEMKASSTESSYPSTYPSTYLLAMNDDEQVEQRSDVGDDDKAFLIVAPIRPVVPVRPTSYYLPGEFALRTTKGYYLTAINGGGRYTDPTIISSATTATAWEKFRILLPIPQPTFDKSFQTANGNWITAVNSGGMTSNALHTDATQIGTWEQFRMLDLSDSGLPTYYALQTYGGNFITAVGAGGQYTNAIHTDATSVGSWEEFKPVKCDDLGNGYSYFIIPSDGIPLTAPDGGGNDNEISLMHGTTMGEPANLPWARFTLMQQSDGTYALKTPNNVNYVTALQGGGVVQDFIDCGLNWFTGLFSPCVTDVGEIFHTDATQVGSWEKFRIVDEGDCKYTIQTSSGFYMGLYQDSGGHWLFTTRRSSISNNEKFELVMTSLASPPILH